MTAGPIPEHVRYLANMAYASRDNDPTSLLDVPGCPPVVAELYFAQLIGMDEEVIDFVRLRRVERELLTPIRRSISKAYMAGDPSAIDYEPLRVARYVPMSYVSTLDLSPAAIPSELFDYFGRPNPTTYLWRLAFLRYRREL